MNRRLTVGTRGSALAQWQTNYVIAALKRIAPELEIETRIIKTTGDQNQTSSLAELGGLGVFTNEIEHALLGREIDLAVHSLKDLPTETASGLRIAAVPEREDARDCIVARSGAGLMQLPTGARIGTSSARRTAQILARRPDAQILPLRGNVDTRLRKAHTAEYDAVVLAAAGILRLGRASEITEYLALDTFLPDPGQGALAIEIRSDDAELETLVAQLDHASTHAAVTAERSFLRALGGGCRMPIGAYADMEGERLALRGMVASDDGTHISRGEITGDAARAEDLGAALAAQLNGRSTRLVAQPHGAPEPPLKGRKILITRAHEQADAFVEKVRALGGEPIEFPTIDFAPLEDFRALDDALARVKEYDWVVFTSVNGVRFVAERLHARETEPSVLAAARIAAIGPATARAVERLGLRVDFIPTKFLGDQIALELPVEGGQHVLLLRADIASDALERKLAERGATVPDVDAYRTIIPSRSPVDLKALDAVTFTSSSTVRNFLRMADGRAEALITQAAVFCIGPVTADTARELGLHVDAVAAEHTLDGLVAAMLSYYREKRS